MASKLDIYNRACLLVGETPLISLTDNRRIRKLFDHAWDTGLIRKVLEKNDWNSAINSIEIYYDAERGADFGYRYAHKIPDDWVRTVIISPTGDFSVEVKDIVEEAGYWWSDYETLYIRYVSDDAQFGGDISKWTDALVDYAAYALAEMCALVVTQSETRMREIRQYTQDARVKAGVIDAQNEPIREIPVGSWRSARRW